MHQTPASGLSLDPGTIVEGVDRRGDDLAGDKYGIYHATKSRGLLNECVEVLHQGGVVALVPTGIAKAQLEAIAEQIEGLARTRAGFASKEGIIALPTSGSTGIPKLVALSIERITRFLHWGSRYFNFDNTTVSLSLSPWNFDISLLDTWAVLAAGGGTVVAAEAARLYDAKYLFRLLEQYRPTFIQVVPSTLDALITAAGSSTHSSVRDMILTGGVTAQPLRAAATRVFPKATFHNVYGATEVNDCLIEAFSAEEFANTETLPLGEPIVGCEIYLESDGVHVPLNEAAEFTSGELFVRTPWMALGYITKGTISPLPMTETLLYPMKDLVSWSNRQLKYQGRCDRIVKIRGQRVNLEEVEHAARRTALVGMACAWLDDSGAIDELHLAYTAPDHGAAPTGLQVRIAISAHLPTFAMPNRLHAFADPFPLNDNGKPDIPVIKLRAE